MKTFYGYKKFCLVFLMGMLIFSLTGCGTRQQSKLKGYPISSDVKTTAQRTLSLGTTPSVKINLYDLSSYEAYGYGNWTFGDPLKSVTRTDIMPAFYDSSSINKKAKLLKFFTITDIHITDKESPNQLIYLQRLHPTLGVGASLYSGIMLYTTHVLDAAVQTINVLHKKIRLISASLWVIPATALSTTN